MTMAQTNQVMHVQVNTRANNKTLFCSFVYADNYYMDRRALWSNLVGHAGLMRNRPWVLMGDFNAALNLEDHSSDGYESNVAMRDFKECVQAMEVSDVNCMGLHFTWNQKPKGSNGILKKIDRILDHSPCVLRIPTVTKSKPKPFKFANFLMYKEGFREVVESGWNVNIEGFAMYRVVKHLKGLKSLFRKLLHDHGNLYEWVNRIRVELDEAQKAIDRDPSSSILLPCAFVNHYDQFLRTGGVTNHLDDHDLYTRVLDTTKVDFMVRDVTDIEVKNASFFMGDDKAPGPDGFTDAFFKKAWVAVGGDITCAIRLIANRVKEGLGDIASINQSVFIPGLDIQKAYDMVDWKFLETILVGFGFHPKMVQWIMVYVSGASYSIHVNGNLHGWFKGKRGLQQGDPLSLYLFTLVMEVLTLMLQRRVHDLFLFARVYPNLVSVIMDALEEFKQVSGLVPSIPKGTAFFCNVPNAIKATILNSMPFAEVNDWRNKFLSLAGRLQLIRSVLSSVHIYWAFVFILPTRIVHELEQLMRGFLWRQGEIKKGKAKVAWDSICMPKHEGGLGIRRIDDFNVALMATHIWRILTHKESLWVKWVHKYKPNGCSFWDVPCRGDVSWGWRKLLQIRSTRWPPDWLSRFPSMAQLHVPLLLDDMDDVILWRDKDGVLRSFLVACVWDTIRARADMVQWYNVVWFPHCIPRHAIHMWLVVQQKLKTQDRLRQWDVWLQVHALCGMDSISPRLADVIAFIVPISKGKKVINILSRIMVAATSYYIWLERNGKLFKKKTSSPDQIVQVILSMVRLKLVTYKFKKMSTGSRLLLDQWKIPSYCIAHDGSSRVYGSHPALGGRGQDPDPKQASIDSKFNNEFIRPKKSDKTNIAKPNRKSLRRNLVKMNTISKEAKHEGMEIKDAEDVVLKNGDLEAGKDGDGDLQNGVLKNGDEVMGNWVKRRMSPVKYINPKKSLSTLECG
ncbi:hypothetical protein Tco_1156590 [Tanacetum coccineum]